MLDYRHQMFIFDLREKFDELSYGAHNLSSTAGLTAEEGAFLENLSKELCRFGDSAVARYNTLRCKI